MSGSATRTTGMPDALAIPQRRLPAVARAIVVLLVVTGVAVLYATKIERRMPDYEVYRRAAARAARAEPLYRVDDGHYQFKYLPAFAVGTLPVGVGPERVVRACWYGGSILLLVVLLRSTVTALPVMRRSRAALIGATFVLLAKFYAHEIELGQVNILMAVLVLLAVVQMRAGRELAAGLLVSAAIVVKPYAVLLVPYLAARRRLGSLAGVALGLGAALILPAVVYGFEGNLRLLGEWWRTVTETTAPNLMDFNNVSAASVFARWLGPGPAAQTLATIMIVALLGIAALVFLMRRRVDVPEPLEVGLLLTLMPLISPQGWDYVFLLSTLAVMLLVNYSDRLPRYLKPAVIAALLIVAFSIFDIMGRPAYQRFMRLSIITMCYLVIIGGLAALRVRRVA
jgi:Glycosyltransferase family 87